MHPEKAQLSSHSRLLDNVTDVSEEQPKNASVPIPLTLFGITILGKLIQNPKGLLSKLIPVPIVSLEVPVQDQLCPILLTVFDKVTDVKELQSQNVSSSIVVMPDGITIEGKLVQPWNAWASISSRPSFKSTEVKLVHSINALSSIFFVLLGMSTLGNELHL